MKSNSDTLKRVKAAEKLFNQDTTTLEKVKSIRAMVKGISPQLDQQLTGLVTYLVKLDKIRKGKVIELSAEHLPDTTEKEKKRKKLVLLIIGRWKKIKSEVSRVRKEIESGQDGDRLDKTRSAGKILKGAKGPLGLITVSAVFIVAATILYPREAVEEIFSEPDKIVENKSVETIDVIQFGNHLIPVSQLRTVVGAECNQESHYHAISPDHTVTTIDGQTVSDPAISECGFGIVEEVEILSREIE